MAAPVARQYSEARPAFGTQKMPFRCFSHSLTGARASNQDRLLTFTLGPDQFALVCDGLGGYPDGEWAAATFAEVLRQTVTLYLPDEETPPRQALEQWLQRAWAGFCQQREQQQRDLMAQTTFALVWLAQDFTLCAHAGDSRLYLLDGQQVRWRSRDHNLYELGLLNGDIDPQVTPAPQGQQALLYRSVSCQKPLKPTLVEHPPLRPGQAVLLCSDGAWGSVDEAQWPLLLTAADPEARLAELLAQAVARCGERADNASALLLQCVA